MNKHTNCPNKAGIDGNIDNSFLQTDSNVLREHSIFICSFQRYQEHPLFTMGTWELYLQKLVTTNDTKGVKTHKIKTKPDAFLPLVLQGYNLSTELFWLF